MVEEEEASPGYLKWTEDGNRKKKIQNAIFAFVKSFTLLDRNNEATEFEKKRVCSPHQHCLTVMLTMVYEKSRYAPDNASLHLLGWFLLAAARPAANLLAPLSFVRHTTAHAAALSFLVFSLLT